MPYYSKSGTHCFEGGDPQFQSSDPLGWLSVRPRTHPLNFVHKTLEKFLYQVWSSTKTSWVILCEANFCISTLPFCTCTLIVIWFTGNPEQVSTRIQVDSFKTFLVIIRKRIWLLWPQWLWKSRSWLINQQDNTSTFDRKRQLLYPLGYHLTNYWYTNFTESNLQIAWFHCLILFFRFYERKAADLTCFTHGSVILNTCIFSPVSTKEKHWKIKHPSPKVLSQLAKLVGIWLIFGCFLVVRLTTLFQHCFNVRVSTKFQSWNPDVVSPSGFWPNFNVGILMLFQRCFNIRFSTKSQRRNPDVVSTLFQCQVFDHISTLQSWHFNVETKIRISP